jgi:hypothetical protein
MDLISMAILEETIIKNKFPNHSEKKVSFLPILVEALNLWN